MNINRDTHFDDDTMDIINQKLYNGEFNIHIFKDDESIEGRPLGKRTYNKNEVQVFVKGTTQNPQVYISGFKKIQNYKDEKYKEYLNLLNPPKETTRKENIQIMKESLRQKLDITEEMEELHIEIDDLIKTKNELIKNINAKIKKYKELEATLKM